MRFLKEMDGRYDKVFELGIAILDEERFLELLRD